MKNKKLVAVAVLVLLAFGISWLIPDLAGAGRENSLVQRVENLEGLVAELNARVQELEQTWGDCCSCDVLHLTPLADFPAEPSEGDLCVVEIGPGWNQLQCYLRGGWYPLGPPPYKVPPITPIP